MVSVGCGALLAMLNSTCRLNPVEALSLFTHSALPWRGAACLWLFAEASASLVLSYLQPLRTFWACDFCLQQALPSAARL